MEIKEVPDLTQTILVSKNERHTTSLIFKRTTRLICTSKCKLRPQKGVPNINYGIVCPYMRRDKCRPHVFLVGNGVVHWAW